MTRARGWWRSEDSLLSIGSRGSVLSIGSRGSVLSVASVGSVGSIGSVGSGLSLLSAGAWTSVGSVLSAQSRWSVLSAQSVRAVQARRTSGTEVLGSLLVAGSVTAVVLWWTAGRVRRSGPRSRPDLSGELSRRDRRPGAAPGP